MKTVTSKQRPITRLQLLRGDFGRRPPPIRPPWALPENEFLRSCNRCDRCAASCPEGIITTGPAGYPLVDFTKGRCTFCGRCAAACAEGAIDSSQEKPWNVTAATGAGCLADGGTVCRVCGEECERGAICFEPVPGRAPRPRIARERCTGCGACVGACPAGAIEVLAP